MLVGFIAKCSKEINSTISIYSFLNLPMMRSFQTILAIIAISSLSSFANTNSDLLVLDYVDQYSAIAVQEMERTGIPASITLAQGIIESRYGMSGLAKNSNNHFGIKCKGNWTGSKYYHKDDDYVNGKLVKSCFRTYDNPADSYYDHSEFLIVNKRYAFLFSLTKTDYKGWAKGLKKAGYATAKNYASMLINTVEKYELYQYDRGNPVLFAMETTNRPTVPKVENSAAYIDFQASPNQLVAIPVHSETLVASAPPPATLIPENYRVGDGLKRIVEAKQQNDFYSDVYGRSSQYLEEVTPNIVGRE